MAKKIKKLNCQGLARGAPELMTLLLPESGNSIISVDLASGEPTVITHYSGDANYRAATLDMVGKAPFYKNSVLYIDDIYLMVMSTSPIGSKIMRDTFDHCFDGSKTFQDKWLEPGGAEWIQKTFLKRPRKLHKGLCVSGDTLIRVKNYGYLPITEITPDHEIWDGETWVKCAGLSEQGVALTLDYSGDFLTPDHKVLDKYGEWKPAEALTRDGRFLTEDCGRLPEPCASWPEVWSMVCRILRNPETWRVPLYLCRLRVRSGVETIRQFAQR